jgi:catechol 2,3-dioxygenase-like lactoylglutathione lyase family enzyme
MLKNARVETTIPAQDLARAKAFYTEKLGLTPSEERDDGIQFDLNGTTFLLFKSAGAASGTHTQASFDVQNVDAEIVDLRSRGVVFEEYDLPGLKTENGIVTLEGAGRGGFFKDTEGNLIGVFQRLEARVTA